MIQADIVCSKSRNDVTGCSHNSTFSYPSQNNVYILALTKRNVNITLTLLYLYRICDVFKEN